MHFSRDGFQASPPPRHRIAPPYEGLSALLGARLEEDMFGNGLASPLPEDRRRQLQMSGHTRTHPRKPAPVRPSDEAPSIPPAAQNRPGPDPRPNEAEPAPPLPDLAEGEALMREMAAQPRDVADVPDTSPGAESNLWD